MIRGTMPNVAHYKGDCTDFNPNQVFGPDTCGASYVAIGAEFDPDYEYPNGEKGRTTIQFKPYLGTIVRQPH